MNKQNHHAAIFDLDGTLLDTLDDLANAANAALHSAGYPQHPVAAYRQFVGKINYCSNESKMPVVP